MVDPGIVPCHAHVQSTKSGIICVMQTEENKKTAIDFLELVVGGKIDEAFEKYIDMSGKHHNAFTPAGMGALLEGMKGAEAQFPNQKFKIQHALANDNIVAIHSHLIMKEKELEMITVHVFKIEGGKIVEMWDCGQNIVGATTNSDGAF